MDYFTRLGVADTFVRVAFVFREKWKLFLTLSVVGHALTLVAMHVSFHFLWLFSGGNHDTHSEHHRWGGTRKHNGVAYATVDQVIMFTIEMMVFAVVMSIPHGAIIRGVAELYAGRESTLKDIVSKSARKMPSMLGASFIVILAYMIPILFPDLVASTVGDGMWVAKVLEQIFMATIAIATYQIYPSIIVENRSSIKGIDRSIELTTNHRLYIFVIMITYGIMKFAFEKLIFDLEKTPHLVRFLTWILMSIFFSCFESIFTAVVYLNIRVSNESMSQEILIQDLDSNSGGLNDLLAGYMALGGGEDPEIENQDLNELLFETEN